MISHISNLKNIYNILAPECKCDYRGTQINANYGDWCWTTEKPCKLLTGVVKYWDWVRCHDKGDSTAEELIKCPGENSGERSLDC